MTKDLLTRLTNGQKLDAEEEEQLYYELQSKLFLKKSKLVIKQLKESIFYIPFYVEGQGENSRDQMRFENEKKHKENGNQTFHREYIKNPVNYYYDGHEEINMMVKADMWRSAKFEGNVNNVILSD